MLRDIVNDKYFFFSLSDYYFRFLRVISYLVYQIQNSKFKISMLINFGKRVVLIIIWKENND